MAPAKGRYQQSETLPVGILLALSGGYMDAYTYLFRDHVFANAQTGNLVLFAVNLSEGRLLDCLRYLVPVLAFGAGVFLAQAVRLRKTTVTPLGEDFLLEGEVDADVHGNC